MNTVVYHLFAFSTFYVSEEMFDRSIFLTSGNLWASSEPSQWRSNFPARVMNSRRYFHRCSESSKAKKSVNSRRPDSHPILD